jgi:hypothetical protein
MDLNTLDPLFCCAAKNLLNLCESHNLIMRPTSLVRTLKYQAKLWRQSRSTDEIQGMIENLYNQDCKFLADLISSVGPQHGPWATNAIPGYSWHNWGLAMDVVFVSLNGIKATRKQQIDGTSEGYKIFGHYAKFLDLTWGGDFKRPDYGHVQFEPFELSKKYNLKEINDHFKALGAV